MKSARLAVFEDSETTRQYIDITLLGSAHQVVATAETRKAALSVVEQMQLGKLAVDVVLLDGNLDHNDFSDAHAIYGQIQRLENQPLVLGISSNFLTDEGLPIPRDYDIGKEGVGRLESILNELPEPATPVA
jgi:chemotaxis response regulator CheB